MRPGAGTERVGGIAKHIPPLRTPDAAQYAALLRPTGCGLTNPHREQLMWQLEAAQLMQPERLQRSAIGVGEIVAHDQRQMERLGDGFDAVDQIDRGPDHREVEVVGGADVAVDDGAIVERDDDFERRFVRDGRARPQGAECRLGLLRCRERVGGDACGLVGVATGKIASNPSPTNFRISPPWSTIALACRSNRSLRMPMTRSPWS
jgi:hypothetical protein